MGELAGVWEMFYVVLGGGFTGVCMFKNFPKLSSGTPNICALHGSYTSV